jgi:group I intron endonuclease
MSSGIYSIVNKVNGHRYIGSAVDIPARWRSHKHHLNKGSHHSAHLQSAWNKYGSDCFQFVVLEECSKDDLLRIEQAYLDASFPEYNNNRKAEGVLGYRFSEEAKNRMSLIHTGFRHTEESKRKMSEIWTGKPRGKYSDERKQKLSLAHKGKKPNENQKLALEIGRHMSPSADTRKKISDAQKGYIPTEETIEKLRAAWVRRKERASQNASD